MTHKANKISQVSMRQTITTFSNVTLDPSGHASKREMQGPIISRY